MSTTMKLSREEAIIAGANKRQKMLDMIYRSTEVNQTDIYGHLYLTSLPGIGKTHLTTEALKSAGCDYYVINGVTSLFAFGISLALINSNNPLLLTVNILVDDCDALFRDEASLNVLKSVLGKNGMFRYEKSMSSQMTYLTDTQKHAIKVFSTNERMGFTVPTHNLRFIFCSNIHLATDEEIISSIDKPATRSSILKMHQNALRSRLRVCDLRKLSPEEHYGLVAYTLRNTECLENLSFDQKSEIVDFMWEHWSDLTEKSIRTGEKMADIMENNPMNYFDIWNDEFIKLN